MKKQLFALAAAATLIPSVSAADIAPLTVSIDRAASPYVAEVYEYCPAPGQFVNRMPVYAEGDTHADMCRKALDAIAGTAGGMVSLGSFGGYITMGFDHTVDNVAGQADFAVLGNAFFDSKALAGEGGSCEPGIIMVSRDVNGNGLPDDPWYEILGTATGTTPGYTVTYHRPDPGHKPSVSDPASGYDDDEYIRWTASGGASGYMPHLIINPGDYYPQWAAEATLSFTGRRIADNTVLEQHGRFKEWVGYPAGLGYADCWPNDDSRAGIDIGRAVDADGRPANLDGIDFVRVYTAVHQQAGALGEISTEVCGMVDLHLAAGIAEPEAVAARAFFAGDRLRVLGARAGSLIEIYDISGRLRHTALADGAVDDIDVHLPAGIYLVRFGTHTIRAAK